MKQIGFVYAKRLNLYKIVRRPPCWKSTARLARRARLDLLDWLDKVERVESSRVEPSGIWAIEYTTAKRSLRYTFTRCLQMRSIRRRGSCQRWVVRQSSSDVDGLQALLTNGVDHADASLVCTLACPGQGVWLRPSDGLSSRAPTRRAHPSNHTAAVVARYDGSIAVVQWPFGGNNRGDTVLIA